MYEIDTAKWSILAFFSLPYRSRVMIKSDFAYSQTKAQISFVVIITAQLFIAFVFAR